MQFLAPLFLAGLAALAVPVLIHLIQRERKEALQFPSLMFLRQVPYKSVRRRRIRNWFLFALRCLALVLLVAAFARPFVARSEAAAGTLDPSREVVVLLDRSYSMSYGDRWTRALAAARAAVEALGPQDRGTIVFFDAGAAAAGPGTSEKLRLNQALDTARVGSGTTRYGPALKLAQGLLEASLLPNREVVLISDFQRSGWDGDAGARMPPGTIIRPVAVNEAETSNVSVTDVSFRREMVSGRERVTATARLANKGAQSVNDHAVVLQLDGRDVETVRVDLSANGVATAAFPPFTLPDRETRGTVRAAADALEKDNAFHFVLSPGQAIGVLIVDGSSESTSLYVRRALALAERPAFRVETRRGGELRAADVSGRAVVVLNDVPYPGGETGRRLRELVESGSGLIVALGERTGGNGWGEAGDMMPGSPGAPADRINGGGATIGYLDYAHPVFELFRAPRSGDFSSSRFFRYRPVTMQGAVDGQAVVARFDDGTPALIERKVGAGRVLVWTSTLDTYWNDLALQPIFLPFVHQLVRHAAGYGEPSPWFRAGQVLDVARLDTAASGQAAEEAAAQSAAGETLVVVTPAGGRMELDRSRLLRVEEQGFYSVRRAGGSVERAIAVNLDLSESDLSPMDPQELASAVEPRGTAAAGMPGTATLPIEERERRQALWWYLLVAALLLLAVETAVSNRLSRRRRLAES